jgi:FemAB-related protein (PEP-CTERM system-associated)
MAECQEKTMSVEIRVMQEADAARWDDYVAEGADATPYHLSGWQSVIENAYGHQTHFLMAERKGRVVGILPLVHMKHALSGNSMISMPFLDMAGILADSHDVSYGLISEALSVMHRVRASSLQLRQAGGFQCRRRSVDEGHEPLSRCLESGNRVRMICDLPDDPDALMSSFKSKLRSQIHKPIREGLEVKSGGEEYLDEFYRVFEVNMRDLGSPVHSKEFLRSVLRCFVGRVRIFLVYLGGKPVAASITCEYRDTVYNPWASSLKKYRHLSPNMLLYWSMLEYACERGYSRFDFGRSTWNEGTYRFKKQWGSQPSRLCWYSIANLGVDHPRVPVTAENAKIGMAVQLWKKMPVPVSRVVGPAIRKHIGL